MKYIHYQFDVRKPEGIYHFRLYSYDGSSGVFDAHVTTGYAKDSLNQHFYVLQKNTKAVVLPSGVVRSFGPHAVTKEGELTQGIPSIDTLKLEIDAIPELTDFVEAVRDTETQIWVEIVLEQFVLDAITTTSSFFAPRKQRMYFWGQLNRKDCIDNVNSQKWTTKGYSNTLISADPRHLGTLTLSFTSWLKMRLNQDPKPFLDSFKAKFTATEDYASISKLLYYLIKWITPTIQFAITDYTLTHYGGTYGPDESDNQCPLQTTYQFEDELHHQQVSLDQVFWRVRTNGGDSALFNYDATSGAGSGSLYSIKDLGGLLLRIADEFFLFPQCELPTMEEAFANKMILNDFYSRVRFWPLVTRWLLMELGETSVAMYLDPFRDTIQLTYAAAWAAQYKAEMPTVDGLLPTPAYTIVQGLEEGTDESITLLSRFVGQTWVVLFPNPATLMNDAHGWELYSMVGGVPHFITSVVHGSDTYTNWATYHATRRIDTWGSVKSMLVFQARGNGIEPYGAHDLPGAKAPQKTYGQLDFGDFPLMRAFTVQTGLMESPVVFACISATRNPGADSEYKLIEVGALQGIPPSRVQESPVPPAPTVDTTGPVVGILNPTPSSVVTGTINIKATATDNVGVVQVTAKVESTFIDTTVVNPTGGIYSFSWDSTSVANGTHKIFVTAVDAAGNSTKQSVSFNVAN